MKAAILMSTPGTIYPKGHLRAGERVKTFRGILQTDGGEGIPTFEFAGRWREGEPLAAYADAERVLKAR